MTGGGGSDDGGGVEVVEGGDVRVAVPATLLDECASLSDILNAQTWRDVLDAEDRSRLRALLPMDPAASDQDVEALVARLFDPNAHAASSASEPASSYFHFGNPSARVWREMKSRERHPEVMRHRAALLAVERGILEHEVRLQHNRLMRNGLSMKHAFDATPAEATPAMRVEAWRNRPPSPSPEEPIAGPPSTPPVGPSPGDGRATATPGEARAAFQAAEAAAAAAMQAAVEAAAAAKALAVATGGGGAGALAALEAAEAAMNAAEAAKATARQTMNGESIGIGEGGAKRKLPY